MQQNSSTKTRIERERKPLKIYKENTILFDGSHNSYMHNSRSLCNKSNTEENQTLCSSINKRKYWVLHRVLHEWLLNKKESCKLSRSVHVKKIRKKIRRKVNYCFLAETKKFVEVSTKFVCYSYITNFCCQDGLDFLQ